MTFALATDATADRAAPSGLTRVQSTQRSTDIWLTPPAILRCLGAFDLDPCAAPPPRPWPTARQHIALPQDGLAMPWHGRVWLNPPYGSHTGQWLARLADHGNGIALIFARTDTAMFHASVFSQAFAVLFLRGRIRFHDRCGRVSHSSGGAPSCLVAYGAANAVALASCGLDGRLVVLA